MRKRLVIGLLLVSVLLVAPLLRSGEVPGKDILYTGDGHEHYGSLERITEDEVIFITADGEQTFPKADVKSVDIGKYREGDGWTSIEDITDTLLTRVLDNMPSSITLQREYPNAGYLVLYENFHVTLNPDSSSTMINRLILQVITERGQNEAIQSFSYFKDNQDVLINFARSIDRFGKITSLDNNAVEDASVFSTTPEYQRLRSKKFALKDVPLGAVVDFQITRTTDKHSIFDPFYFVDVFQRQEPVLFSSFSIKYPENFDMDYRTFNMEEGPAKSSANGYKTLLWQVEDLPGYVAEDMMPPSVLILPSVVVTTEKDWDDIGSAYYAKMQAAFAKNTKTRAKVKELLSANPKNRIETIYNFIAENIQMESISFGAYRSYPKSLDQILSNGKASMQDMAFLFWGMLKLAGLDPEFCLFPSKSSFNSELDEPTRTLEAFSQCAVKIEVNGEYKFLLPLDLIKYTTDHNSFYDVKGLLVKENGGEIFENELLPPIENTTINRIKGKLHNNGTLAVDYQLDIRGLNEAQFRALKTKAEKEIANYFEELAKGLDKKANLIDYTLEGYKDLEEELEVSMRCEIPNFAFTAGGKYLAFNLPNINYSAYGVGYPKRTYPIFRSSCLYMENDIELELPDGYDLYHTPEPVDEEAGDVVYKVELKTDDNILKFKDVYCRKTRWIDPEDYQDYKALIEARAQFAKEKFVLTNK